MLGWVAVAVAAAYEAYALGTRRVPTMSEFASEYPKPVRIAVPIAASFWFAGWWTMHTIDDPPKSKEVL